MLTRPRFTERIEDLTLADLDPPLASPAVRLRRLFRYVLGAEGAASEHLLTEGLSTRVNMTSMSSERSLFAPIDFTHNHTSLCSSGAYLLWTNSDRRLAIC